MKSTPQDTLVVRRKEKLITIGFRTTREKRDEIEKVAHAAGFVTPSSLLRVAVDEYLARAARR